MKKQLINYSKLLLLTVLFVGAYGCQTEQLNLNDEMITANAKGKKNKAANNARTFSECTSVYQTTDLYAGQHILVGNVSVEVVGDNYHITYNITDDGYCLTSTHLSVVSDPNDFPMTNKGNPKNGHFEFSGTHDCVSTFTYEVPTSKGNFIAAHAVVNCVVSGESSDTAAELVLPDSVNVCITDKASPTNPLASYFNITIAEGNSLSGDHLAWCLDWLRGLDNGTCFDGGVYSSYDSEAIAMINQAAIDAYTGSNPFGGPLFNKTENFGAMNWLMNQDLSAYNYADVQFAIWKMVEQAFTNDVFGADFDDTNGMALYNMAMEHNDFVPGCDEFEIVIIVDHNYGLQPIFVLVPVPCDTPEPGDCDETAWAAGCDFPGNNWATYFQYGEESGEN